MELQQGQDAQDSLNRDFHHPFTPYEIQLQFMQALYGCLEDGKVAIFESPTGKKKPTPLRALQVMLTLKITLRYRMCSTHAPPQALGSMRHN